MAVSLDRLDAARQHLREERRRCVDEREAFRAFQKEVGGLQATAPASTPRTAPAIGHRQTTDSSLTRVRRSYERTVMSVPHYDAEYGDSFEDSVSAEFGPDVATVFQSASVFSPALRHTVVSAAAAAVDERTEFVRVVDEESESIESMRDEVAAIVGRLSDLDDALYSACGFDELLTLYSEVSDLRDRLSTLVEQRQKTITNHRRALSSWVPDVTEFFYEDLPTRYPVLATLADTGENLATATRQVERQLASTS